MRSRANFRTHPLHPPLTDFPLAFLIGALLADLAGRVFDVAQLWTVGAYLALAGIVAGLLAAVPGIIDYRYTVPPESSGKRRARKHALVNVSALVLFAIARWVRGAPGVPPDTPVLVLEAIGAGLLIWGGWMGGTLVFRNQMGVDHRYAGAGKWREVTIDRGTGGGGSVVVARADELKPGQMKLVRLADRRLVVARTDDGYVAFDDHCTHRGGSLAGGTMACGIVTCPWHGSQFDVRTGAVSAGPAKDSIRTYPVEERGGELHLSA
jgi:nitrite reductase/ring-hydroxylating ferredoxin subunit/uncharacterized membrane protein